MRSNTATTLPSLNESIIIHFTTNQNMKKNFISNEERLCSLAKDGNISKARSLIDESGVGVNCTYRASETVEYAPLLSAIRHNQKEMVAFLLERGADPRAIVDGYPIYDFCFITKFSYIDKLKMSQLLIDSRPEILDPILENITNSYHATKYAAEQQDPEAAAIIAQLKAAQQSARRMAEEERAITLEPESTLRRRREKSFEDISRKGSDETSSNSSEEVKVPSSKIKAGSTSSIAPATASNSGCSIM